MTSSEPSKVMTKENVLSWLPHERPAPCPTALRASCWKGPNFPQRLPQAAGHWEPGSWESPRPPNTLVMKTSPLVCVADIFLVSTNEERDRLTHNVLSCLAVSLSGICGQPMDLTSQTCPWPLWCSRPPSEHFL